MKNTKLFDLSFVSDMLGNEDELNNLIHIFVETTTLSLQTMNEGFKENNSEKIAFHAHKMKASLDTLKIQNLYDDVRKIDKKFKVEEMPHVELQKIVEKMNSVLEEVFLQLGKRN